MNYQPQFQRLKDDRWGGIMPGVSKDIWLDWRTPYGEKGFLGSQGRGEKMRDIVAVGS